MQPVVLLLCSNVFMPLAWYGHRKDAGHTSSMVKISVSSWMRAFFACCFQVPANRSGSGYFTATQHKRIQSFIQLAVFSGCAMGSASSCAATTSSPLV